MKGKRRIEERKGRREGERESRNEGKRNDWD